MLLLFYNPSFKKKYYEKVNHPNTAFVTIIIAKPG